MWTDPITYIALYALSVVIAVPTIRRITEGWEYKPWERGKPDYALAFTIYGGSLSLLLLAPITVVMYWGVYKFGWCLMIHSGLLKIIRVTAEFVLPEDAHYNPDKKPRWW